MSAAAADLSALPIIDLSKLDNPATKEEFYKELRHLAKDIGFFYLVGHGIDTKLRDDLQAAARKFFALPQDEKDKLTVANSPHFRGYVKVADELTRNKPDYREQINFGHQREALPAEAIAGDNIYLQLLGPNQYPDGTVPELRALELAYWEAARAVTTKLLRAFLVALGLPEDGLDIMFDDRTLNGLKLVRYPPNDGGSGHGSHGEEEEQARLQGCGPHKDGGFLTLLWQDNVGGLQVQNLQGEWIDVPPVEGSYVINIGEALELATNGYLIANPHQVVSRPGKGQDRYAMPFFLRPSLTAERIPLLPLSDELKAQANGVTSDPLNPLFYDLKKLSLKGAIRSHHNVAERFYPEQYKIALANNNNLV